jgi:hypothetical protein
MDSQISRSLLRILAMSSMIVRTNELLSVETEWFVRVMNAVKASVMGTAGIRESVYSGNAAYLYNVSIKLSAFAKRSNIRIRDIAENNLAYINNSKRGNIKGQ